MRPGACEGESQDLRAVGQLILGICDAASTGTAETVPVVVGCLTELAEKGIDPEDEESYYSDEEDHGKVDPTVAARGLGQAGHVPIAESLWSRFASEDLRGRYQNWSQKTHGVGSSDVVGVREMLDALVRDGALRKHKFVQEASGKAQVRPKSSEKCAFIFNCIKHNACDDRKPRGFQLPQIERLRRGGGGQATESRDDSPVDEYETFLSHFLVLSPKRRKGAT